MKFNERSSSADRSHGDAFRGESGRAKMPSYAEIVAPVRNPSNRSSLVTEQDKITTVPSPEGRSDPLKPSVVVIASYKLPANESRQRCIPPGFSVADSGQSHEFVLLTWEDGSWAATKDVMSPGADDTRAKAGLAKRLEDALDKWTAKGLVEPGWRLCTEFWSPEVSDGMVSPTEGIDTVHERWHAVLGEPVVHLSEVMGVDPALSNVLGGIAC